MAQHSVSAGEDEAPEPAIEELGALVLRVWRERGTEQGLRVRILASEGQNEPASMAVLADPEAALEAVRKWLDARQEPPGPSRG
ncbi:hypothetical protein SA2016_1352 [Sinomonas atrocyanea]|uniref:Uncharacterized protein n=1 Tax=Sinomonas atrocyanea TaxID=37927 RepID=A0A127A305_9MICC|nr:hypothetical protein [Sinomonas atrocyanea]AMM32032.1 hypothetical protein SA2016_1352 [Sinomonas atrocyanea]GEB65203.1 hypothetical protein SAT01_26510 [Sinomonas atrocyanea]GGG69427.1 hypothetical protein GCM10007172_21940 [Sinomonas atrocyanea]